MNKFSWYSGDLNYHCGWTIKVTEDTAGPKQALIFSLKSICPHPQSKHKIQLIIGQTDLYDLVKKNEILHHFLKSLEPNPLHLQEVQKHHCTLWTFKNQLLFKSTSPKYSKIYHNWCYMLRSISTKQIYTFIHHQLQYSRSGVQNFPKI